MSNKTNGLCCGGDYTVSASLVNPNAHQGSPSKRHNVSKMVEHIQLANYIAEYVENHTTDVRSLSDLIYAGIEQFYKE